MHTTLKRLQERNAAEWRIDERFNHYQGTLTDIVEKASRTAVEYAKSFEDPVIMLEDKATEAEIRVEYVNAVYTSQTCHACNRLGRRDEQAEFVCPNDGCHITEFQADINAAANIAGHVDPWGESVPWEPERNDSPRNGSACDSATVHHEASERSSQMTLAAYQDETFQIGYSS
jgi:putative transposase